MTEFDEFADTVFEALRPITPPHVLADVDFLLEHGETNQAVVGILVSAAKRGLPVPADVLTEVRTRVAEGVFFRPKDARMLEHFLPQIHTVAA